MDSFQAQLESWIDSSLSEQVPMSVVAYAFSLFELSSFSGNEPKFGIELVGASEFSVNDPDWACEEVFQATPRSLSIPIKHSGNDWEECLDHMISRIEGYLKTQSTGTIKLNAAQGVGVGFVDGDLRLIDTDKEI